MELNNPYQVMNEELLNNNDYLQMTGQNEEYTTMSDSSFPNADFENMQTVNTYDNITTVRPVGNGPVPKVPMEVVPMIQLESISGPVTENELQIGVKSPLEESCDDDNQHATDTTYLNMGSSPEKYDLDEYDSVFLDEKIPNKVPHINGDSSSVPLLCKINPQGEKHDFGGGGCNGDISTNF